MKFYKSYYDNWPIMCNIICLLYKTFVFIIILLIIQTVNYYKHHEYTYYILNNKRINYTNYLKNRGLFKKHCEHFNEFNFTNKYGTNTLSKQNYILIYEYHGYTYIGESCATNIKQKYLYFFK